MSKMLYSVDRFEGSLAVLVDEEGNTASVPLDQLPNGTKPGDMLRLEGNEYTLVTDEVRTRRAEVLRLLKRLRNG